MADVEELTRIENAIKIVGESRKRAAQLAEVISK